MTHYVFIYGTLRSGEINDIERLAARMHLPAPTLLGKARVPGRLYDFGDWPGLVETEGPARIAGDVYAVSDELLVALDAVEEYEPDKNTLFVRRQVSIAIDAQSMASLYAAGPPPGIKGPGGSVGTECQTWGGIFYYPVDPTQVGNALPMDHDDWVSYRQSRTR